MKRETCAGKVHASPLKLSHCSHLFMLCDGINLEWLNCVMIQCEQRGNKLKKYLTCQKKG